MQYERRGRRFGPRLPPKPVEIGKEYDVEIEETSRRGEGIARIKGLVCFVPNTKPGEHVKIRITRISRRFAEAEVVGKTEEKVVELYPKKQRPKPKPKQKLHQKKQRPKPNNSRFQDSNNLNLTETIQQVSPATRLPSRH
jgi:predicted RNA-binding protein with TRAM domain